MFKHSQRLKIYMAKLAQVKIFLDKLVHTSLKRTHFRKWFKSLWVGKIRLVKFHLDSCIFRVVKFHAFDNLVLYSVADLEAPKKSLFRWSSWEGGGASPPPIISRWKWQFLEKDKNSQQLKNDMTKLASIKIFLAKLVHTSLKRTLANDSNLCRLEKYES